MDRWGAVHLVLSTSSLSHFPSIVREQRLNHWTIALFVAAQPKAPIVRKIHAVDFDQHDPMLGKNLSASFIVDAALLTAMNAANGLPIWLVEVSDGNDVVGLPVFLRTSPNTAYETEVVLVVVFYHIILGASKPVLALIGRTWTVGRSL